MQQLHGHTACSVSWNIPVGITSFRVVFQHDWASNTARLMVDRALHREYKNIISGNVYTLDLQHDLAGPVKRAQCVITIGGDPKIALNYVLTVNGKSYEDYKKAFAERHDVWLVVIGKRQTRIVLDKQELTIWGRGALLPSRREFADTDGVITSFRITDTQCQIITKVIENGGIYHELIVQEPDGPARKYHQHTDLY